MNIYRPVLIRRWHLVAIGLLGLKHLLGLWPFLLILWAIFSPIGPHVLIQENQGPSHTKDYWTQCNYLGVEGTTRINHHGPCPFIKIIDRRGQ